MPEKKVDVVIVGAGPAGLTAGIYASRLGLETVILEEKTIGGQVVENPLIENYPGFTEISGTELIERMKNQAEKYGVKINVFEPVKEIKLERQRKIVVTDSSHYSCRLLLICTGAKHRELGVNGEKKFFGRGVSYCPVCDGPLFRERKVAVVGGGESAATAAIYLKSIASQVYLIHRRNRLRAEKALRERILKSNVKILWNSVVSSINGDRAVREIVVRNLKTSEEKKVEVDGIFILVGTKPRSELARKTGIKTDEKGYIVVDRNQRTNIEGIYAAGDVTGEPAQITKAVGEATVAILDGYNTVLGGPYGFEGN